MGEAEWGFTTLGQITTKIGSGATPRGGSSVYVHAGTAFIRSQNVLDFHFSDSGLAYITEDAAEALRGVSVSDGDVLVNITGDSVARVCAAPKIAARVSQHVAIVRPDPQLGDSRFIMYSLLNPPMKARLLNTSSSGATRKALTKEHLQSLPVALPPLSEQRRIAGVLGALDDLIEVNRGLATDLRDLTRAAFDRLQGGATRSTTLGELINLQYGKALPATQRRTGRYPVVSSAGIVDSHDIGLVEGPGVVVGRKGTVGSVTWVDSDFFPIDTAFYVESKLPLLYVYWLLKSQDLASMNTDSAVPGLNRENALSLRVDQPDDEAMWEFVTSASPLWSAARDLEAEIRELASTRDELLPLLMSGRVRVAEIVAA